jgi:hypothetical protein
MSPLEKGWLTSGKTRPNAWLSITVQKAAFEKRVYVGLRMVYEVVAKQQAMALVDHRLENNNVR